MKNKLITYIFIFVLFVFIAPNIVKADKGDLRYEITDVDIRESTITFKGWAYIHKTNNYISIVDRDTGRVIKDNGGQKITISALKDGNIIDSKTVSGSDKINYNFYCELYFKSDDGTYQCTKNRYLDVNHNDCNGADADVTSQCYYEDIYFEISFDTSEWDVYSDEQIMFKISAYNNHYGKYTESEILSISRASVSNYSTDYVLIDEGSVESKVAFIASYGLLKNYELTGSFQYSETCTHGVWSAWGNNIYHLADTYEYPKGRSKTANTLRCKSFLGPDCVGTNMYAIKVKKGAWNGICYFAVPSYSDNSDVAVAFGSHVKPVGEFSIKVKNDRKCEPKVPSSGELSCNNSKTFNSECDELTVKTDYGSAIVTINQTGVVSSVLTPDSVYDGGGFNFGILYTNTIKWNYAGKVPSNSDLHNAVNEVMINKLKTYNSYVADINITELKLGSDLKDTNFLYKRCYTSDEHSNYYDKELTVTCLFHLPESKTLLNGDVNYLSGLSGLGISNKYYTPLGYKGEYNISAKIVGMDRIKSNVSKDDIDEKKKPSDWGNYGWTGNWEDYFSDCVVDVYPLLYTNKEYDYSDVPSLNYKFIYRPIDIYNPFPNRNAGINWFDWISNSRNRDRLENSYNKTEYLVNLNNQTIRDIKNYNKNSNYLDWSKIKWDSVDEKYYSEFINENDYIKRVGDN